MTFFTSAWKLLAHGAPNWDTQLRTDMTFLENMTDQPGFTPGLGGSGATIGSNALVDGYCAILGKEITYHGRLGFGSTASFGPGAAVLTGMNGLNTVLSMGHGYYRRTDGSLLPLTFQPASASTMYILLHKDNGLVPAYQIGTPAQGDGLFFTIHGVLT